MKKRKLVRKIRVAVMQMVDNSSVIEEKYKVNVQEKCRVSVQGRMYVSKKSSIDWHDNDLDLHLSDRDIRAVNYKVSKTKKGRYRNKK